MNELTISKEFSESLPTVIEGLHRAQNIFESIKSFEDIEKIFLKGAGLSPNTYRSYLQAVKQLYEFTDGLNPLQIQPRHIEAFYDDLVTRADRNTAYLRIAGLKRFFKGIRSIIPFYTSPFEIMNGKLKKKLSRTKKGYAKKAMTPKEISELLGWLEANVTVQGLEKYAIIFMLVSSGLRADELLQLRHKDIEFSEGTWTAFFTGKGSIPSAQPLYEPAVKACVAYFRLQFHRYPKPEDALFWTQPRYKGEPSRPLTYQTLYNTVKRIGAEAKAAGIIKRDITWSPHLLRRTVGTILDKKGMSIVAISHFLRHSNIETTARHYIDNTQSADPYLDKVFKNED